MSCLLTLQDPGYAAFLFEQLQTPASHEAGGSGCQVCSTPLHQLRQEALRALHAPVLSFGPDMAAPPTTTAAATASFLPQPVRFAASSSSVRAKQLSKGQPPAGSALPLVERSRAPGWLQSPQVSSVPKASVQVTVAGGQMGGSLGTVTIQAQQYLEGVWSISRVNNFLPPPKVVRLFAKAR